LIQGNQSLAAAAAKRRSSPSLPHTRQVPLDSHEDFIGILQTPRQPAVQGTARSAASNLPG